MTKKTPDECVELLKDSKSAKRKSAARAIGKTKDPAHGPKLLDALISELKDKRTWETQCAMIRALGDVGCQEARPELWRMSAQDYDATMLYHEIGFALCRIEPITNDNLLIVRKIIDTQNQMIVGGAFKGILLLKIVPSSQEDVRLILAAAERDTENEGQIITKRCYIAAACCEWKFPEVEEFLKSCENSKWNHLQQIVAEAQAGRYPKWQPW